MQIITLKVGQMGTNCYLVWDQDTSQCLIIDPGEDADFITTTILENKLSPQGILLTHGHYDHCLAALDLKLNFNIPIYLHPKDLFLYQKAHKSAIHWSRLPVGARHDSPANYFKLPPIDHFLSDQEIIPFGSSSLQVLHTPGHTPGSVCFLSPVIASPATAGRGNLTPPTSYLFTGDTLFADTIGRTDLSYSSPPDLKSSLSHLKSVTRNLKSVLIYPGHEASAVPFPSLV